METPRFKAIGIGEILWDLLPEGKKLGGAPTNFAFHASQLGIQSAIISATGNDDLGNKIHTLIEQSEIINFIEKNDKPTGTVSVQLDNEGVPTYVIHKMVAWDYINPSSDALKYAVDADAICFGSLGQRSAGSRKSIQKILAAAPANALKVFDINLRQQFYSKEIIRDSLNRANILKINEEEIAVFADMFDINGGETRILTRILQDFTLNYIALTKGKQGSLLIGKNEKSFIETPEVKVVDTVGAGDSFTAAMVAGFLNKKSLREIHQLAVDVSAFVCTRDGATPRLPAHLKERLT